MEKIWNSIVCGEEWKDRKVFIIRDLRKENVGNYIFVVRSVGVFDIEVVIDFWVYELRVCGIGKF